ncbi:MAG: ATP-binding protein, partial [Desulfovibrionales bacterium]
MQYPEEERSRISSTGNGYCLWEDPEMEFNVGVIGTGAGFRTILDLIYDEAYREYVPGMRFVALAEPGVNQSNLERVRKMKIPIYNTFQAMLTAHPEINFIIELIGGRLRAGQIRSILPDRVSFLDHNAAVFLCCMHNMFQVSTHCQLNLDRHKALLEAIIDKVQEDIMLLDKQCRVVDLNRNIIERTGKEKHELVGLPCWKVQTMKEEGLFCAEPDQECPFFKTLSTKEYSESMLNRVGADGKLHYYRIYAYPIFDEIGNVTNILVMRRDITTRTSLERSKQQEEKLSVVGEMSMYLAHEIRNPLFAIGGFTNSLLNASNLDEKQREKVKIIAEEANRLDSLLTSILNFAGPVETRFENINLNGLVREAAERFRKEYESKEIDFCLDLTEEIPAIRADREKVVQSLGNLVENSVEAISGKGKITIRTRMGQEFVILEVEDSGEGMTDSEIDQAFSPFFSTKKKGYGLGLSMIKKIVEETGGRVELQSQQNVGTTVRLSLPPVL